MQLIAILPNDRSQIGELQIWRNGALVQKFPVLGKADNALAKKSGNASRDQLFPFGDTPTGKWKVTAAPKPQADTSTYGIHPVFMLWPLDGNAMISHDAKHRRVGIWLHAGVLNGAGQLRPTYGCLRVHNETMGRLHELIAQHGPITTLEVKET